MDAPRDSATWPRSWFTVQVKDSTFSQNFALFGGSIATDFGVFRLSYSTLSSNAAAWGGGVLLTGGLLTIEQSSITQNTASVSGGGVYFCRSFAPPGFGCTERSGTLTFKDTVVTGNSPDDFGP
jgi:hypothetical protein